MKNEVEAKRRIRFNEQLDTLKSLLFIDGSKNSNKRSITREALLNSAIQEISKLRQQLEMSQSKSTSDATPLQRLAIGIFPTNYYQESLLQPLNRSSYSLEDLERTFETLFAREIETFFNITSQRTEQTIAHTIKMLGDMSKQIGKPEFILSVGVLEQIYHAVIKFNAKDLKRLCERNWTGYQTLKRQEATNLILFIDAEIGSFILNDMAMFQYFSGNLEESKRYFGYNKQLLKKLSHKGTTDMFLSFQAFDFVCSVDLAEKINQLVPRKHLWSPMTTVLLGKALIAAGRHQEGLQKVEEGIGTLASKIGHLAEVCFASSLLEAYVQARSIEKGILFANYVLKKLVEFNVDSFLGRAEILRHKATLLMMKKFPDFVPQQCRERINDSSVADLIAFNEQLTLNSPPTTFGPQTPSSTSLTNLPKATLEDVNEDIELMLRSAINLAHSKGLCMVELNGAIDLVMYFMHCGDKQQAEEAAQLVRETCERMKGDPLAKEFQRAREIIAMVESNALSL